jgi:hypothetical protein
VLRSHGRKVWDIMAHICGKRLAPVLKETVIRLERCREVRISDTVRRETLQDQPCHYRSFTCKREEKTADQREVQYKARHTAAQSDPDSHIFGLK